MVGEGTTKQRAEHSSDAVRGPVEADHLRAPLWFDSEADDGECARSNASTAQARDGPTNDQRCRTLGNGTDETADLEDGYGGDEECLQGKILESLAPG